ncbi:MAG: hypothetical protein HZA89_08660 [Verrucomicrobia bacterium]|nr:hypothetical protein [Verrucomicrobiota bacterium]
MPASLDPLIAQKLEAFGRRWRRLVLARGVAGSLFTLLAGMTLVAVADFLVLMPDGLRLALSGVCYAVTLAVFWWTSGRALLHLPGPRELARLVEKAEPQLREDLLSAVELGKLSAAAQWDSPVFRALLQENVASRLRNLRIESLLPRQLIAFWLRAAAAVLVVCGALLLVPGFHYDRLMARAFAPLADVERVSRVKIAVLEPTAADRWQPQGDTMTVVVEISGPEPRKVTLETFSKTGERARLTMNPLGGRRFSAGVPLGADNLQFRVRAGDGMTRKFSVETRPRPGVVKFEKTYQFPAYSRLAPRRAVEDHGDLIALEGSEVKLSFAANQPLQRASLEMEIKGKTNFLALTVSTNRAEGVVPLKFAGAYRVHLVAAETAFENKFSPQYELRPIPDLVPRVTIDQPRQDLVVAPEEVLMLQGTAGDDIGLARVFQSVLVNEEPFGDFTLSEENKTNLVVTRAWDLLQLKATPGDRVTTKLVAIDLKGSRAESAPLHLVIGTSGLNAKRLLALEAKRALHESLAAARNTAQKAKAADLSNRALKGNELQAKQLLLGALTGLGDMEQALNKCWEKLKEALPHARPGRESADLARLGMALSRARRGVIAEDRAQLETALKEISGNLSAPNVRQAVRAPQALADLIAALELAYADLFAAEEGDVIVENLAQLAREQDRMNRQAAAEARENPNAWPRLARRQGGAAQETRVVEELLKDLKARAPRALADRTAKPYDNLSRNREEMEKTLAAETFTLELLDRATRMQKSTELAAVDMRPLNRELGVRADKARDTLAKLAPASTVLLERVSRNLGEIAAAERQLSGPGKRNAQSQARSEAQLKTAQENAAANWRGAVEQIKDRAEAEEVRRDTELQFVADLGKAAQSLSALRAVAGTPVSTRMLEPVREMEKALRTIEAGCGLGELTRGAKHLAQQEQWENQSSDALTSQPKDWNWMGARMKAVPGDLKKAGLPARVGELVAAVPPSPAAQTVAQEMTRRQGSAPAAQPVPVPAEKVYQDLLLALRELEPLLADARQVLGKSAPKLSDMMAGLARTSEDLQKKSSDAVKPDKEAAKVPEEAKDILAKQQDLNKQLDELQQAIRREANIQELGREENRERVRDADDAIALLREPPPRAEDALREAAQANEYLLQRTALTEAAAQQQKLASALNQLAQHYKNLEAGAAADSRQALRRAEEELGIKAMLDEQFALAEKLNELAKQSPEAMLRQLEQELGQNPAMRQELENIAKDTLGQAKDTLQNSARREQELARALESDAHTQGQLAAAAERARQIAEAAREMAEKDTPAVAEDAARARANATAETDLARQSLQTVAEKMPGEFTALSPELAREVNDLVKPLQTAANSFKSAALKAAKIKSAAPEESQVQAAETAQASAERAAERAGELAQQAKSLADDLTAAATAAATPAPAENSGRQSASVVPEHLVEMAKQLAAQARELGIKTVTEISREASKARLDVSREIGRALRATREVATKAQTAGRKSPYEMVKEVAGLVEPLREASKEFRAAAEKGEQLSKEAVDGDIERAATNVNEKSTKAAEQAAQMAQQAKELADALSGSAPAKPGAPSAQPQPATPVQELAKQARQLAQQAGEMARKEIPALGQQAAQAGAKAQAELQRAQEAMKAAASGVPADFSAPPSQLASQMAALTPKLQQAGQGVSAAAAKAGQAEQAGKSGKSGKNSPSAENAGQGAETPPSAKGQSGPNAPAENPNGSGGKPGAKSNESGQGRGQPGKKSSPQGKGEGSDSQPAGKGQGADEQQSSGQGSGAGKPGAKPNPGQGAGQTAKARAEAAAQQAASMAQQAEQIAAALAGMGKGGNNSSGSTASSNQTPTPGNSSGKQESSSDSKPPTGSSGAPVSQQARAQAAAQQPAIAGNVSQAGGDIERAGRHEMRLGTEQGNALQAVGQKTQTVGGQTIPEAQGALEKAPTVAAAQTALDTARTAVEQQVQALDAAMKLPGNRSAAGGQQASDGTSQEQGKWMARALDRLDSEMNSQPGSSGQQSGAGESDGKAQPGSSAGGGEVPKADSAPQSGNSSGKGEKPASQSAGKPSAASSAMNAAAEAQRSAMAAARSQGKTPGDKPKSETGGEGSGASIVGGPESITTLPQLRALRAGEWGKLPPKLAQGLSEAQREGVAGEYRTQVEAYFRAVAEKAKDKAP